MSVSHFRPHILDEFFCIVLHDPVLRRAADTDTEVGQYFRTHRTVRHLRMKLQSVHVALHIFDSDVIGIVRSGDGAESLRKRVQFISVRHPHDHLVVDPVQKGGRASRLGATDVRLAVFAFLTGGHRPPERVGELLHAVAYSQHGNLAVGDQFPDVGVDVGGSRVVDGVRAAREYDARQVFVGREDGGRHHAAVEFTVHAKLSDAAGDEMGVLRAEVENGDLGPGEISELSALGEIFFGFRGGI
mmetsp:Transcript_23401/g.53402  ORF Transcript_23401/g.53402 Transcript_23401/m.53402 type:complete len:244 (+) Transcript_23401:1050-1781(+)